MTCLLGHLPFAASGQQKVFHFDGDGIGPGRFVFGFAAQAKRLNFPSVLFRFSVF